MKRIFLLLFSVFIVFFTAAQEEREIKLRDVIKEGPVNKQPSFEDEESAQNNNLKSKTYFTLVSNIEYAPIGIGILKSANYGRPGYFFTLKISEDFITRDKEPDLRSSSSYIFDVDEIFITGGVNTKLYETVDFNIGLGFMWGFPWDASTKISEGNKIIWTNSSKSPDLSFVLTGGFSFNINSIKLLIGYDVAFVKSDDYPVYILNDNSAARLSSLTFGIGF